MCGLKEIFESAGNFFEKSFLQIPLFNLGKIKFNPLYQNFDQKLYPSSVSLCSTPSPKEKANPSVRLTPDTFPFRDGFKNRQIYL